VPKHPRLSSCRSNAHREYLNRRTAFELKFVLQRDSHRRVERRRVKPLASCFRVSLRRFGSRFNPGSLAQVGGAAVATRRAPDEGLPYFCGKLCCLRMPSDATRCSQIFSNEDKRLANENHFFRRLGNFQHSFHFRCAFDAFALNRSEPRRSNFSH